MTEINNYKEVVNEARNLVKNKENVAKVDFYRLKCDSAATRLMSERIEK